MKMEWKQYWYRSIHFLGSTPPGSVGGGSSPNGAPAATLALVPAGLTAIATFPPFATPRSIPAVAVIFAEASQDVR